jgi:beta-lactamase superfamily II metal-dependent hydrolase
MRRLKLPHHGEDEELSAAFLKTLDPDICIVTAPQAGRRYNPGDAAARM